MSPATTTPFVGRAQELEQATCWLATPLSCLCVLGAIQTLCQDALADLLKTSQGGGYLLDPSTPLLIRQR